MLLIKVNPFFYIFVSQKEQSWADIAAQQEEREKLLKAESEKCGQGPLGMSPEEVCRVFSPAPRRPKGTGLGRWGNTVWQLYSSLYIYASSFAVPLQVSSCRSVATVQTRRDIGHLNHTPPALLFYTKVAAFEKRVQDFTAREHDVVARETALRDSEGTLETRTTALNERETYVQW